jgi:hypothetical protein
VNELPSSLSYTHLEDGGASCITGFDEFLPDCTASRFVGPKFGLDVNRFMFSEREMD